VNSILIIVFGPLLAAIIAGLGNRAIGNVPAKLLTTGALFASCLMSWPIFLGFLSGSETETVVPVLDWVRSGAMTFDWALRVDTLTAVMLVVITTVSALVHLYSWGYMDEDPDQPRFFAYLSLFTFAMLMLVTADNLVQMFFGWEGVGLASYLLIGFWFKKPSANAAAIKAFVVNRVGDLGFMLGIFGTFLVFQTTSIPAILDAAPAMQGVSHITFLGMRLDTMTILCLLLFIGAMGKSAQLGLHTWLPDAMEGPTPVSALIHAATMVTAGAGRCYLRRRGYLPVRRDGGHHAMGHQAGDRLFDLFAAWLHVLCRRRRRLWRGHVPPVHARFFQGAAVPWRGFGHPCHAS
jgi:NADH-quinone oxidoreductase subunit L